MKRFTVVVLAFVLMVGCADPKLTEPKKHLRFSDGFRTTLAAGIPVGQIYFEGDCFLTESALVDIASSDSNIVYAAAGITVYPQQSPPWVYVYAQKSGQAMLYLFRFPEEGILDSARVVIR